MRVGLNEMPLMGKSEGVKRYVIELGRALDARDDVTLVRFGGRKDTRVTPLLTAPKIGFLARQLEELAVDPFRAARRTDLLHYTDTYGPLAGHRVPSVITVHDTTFVTHPEAHDAWVTTWLSKLADSTWPRAKAIIAVSDVTARDVAAMGVPKSKIHVISHGIDHARADGATAPQGLTSGRYFAYLGNIEPRKDLPTLVAAFEKVLPDLPDDIELAIAGKHAWGPGLAESVSNNPRIRVLGWLSDEELSSFMARSLAFVYPSRYEGFGLPPMEAMHLGAHVIVGDTPVARETLAEFASYFTPGDVGTLADLLRSSLHTDGAQRAAAQAHTSRYTWARAAELTAEVYRSVLS